MGVILSASLSRLVSTRIYVTSVVMLDAPGLLFDRAFGWFLRFLQSVKHLSRTRGRALGGPQGYNDCQNADSAIADNGERNVSLERRKGKKRLMESLARLY